MKKYENECCDCATESYPCLGNQCPRINVPHLYCDECYEEYDELHCYDGEELCSNCLLEKFEKVHIGDV